MLARRALVGQAAEQYALYPLMRHYVTVVHSGDGRLAAEVESFLAGCKVVDLFKLAKLRQLDAPSAQRLLGPAVADFLRKHKLAYGDAAVRPKHHWMLDVVQTAFRRGFLIDMWIVERLQLRVKTDAELVRNTSTFERSALALVLCSQLHDLGAGQEFDGLRGSGAPCVADALVSGGSHIYVDDVVFHGPEAGVVIACVDDGGSLALLVEQLEEERGLSPQSSAWRLTSRRALWTARACDLATAWRMERANLVVIRL